MQVQTLHHITVTVSNFERSKKFYSEVLGFNVTDVNYEGETMAVGFFFAVGDITIWFLTHKATPQGDCFSEARIGLDHLSFKATNETELQALSDKLLAAGVNTKGLETFPTGNKYIALRDPDNIQLEYWLDK